MRLYHVSEDGGIKAFVPRPSSRRKQAPAVPVVWALDERHVPNYLAPRDCPRVTYHAGPETTNNDLRRFFSAQGCTHVVAIEQAWFARFLHTKLYLYAFDAEAFALQDAVAGYYVSEQTVKPLAVTAVENTPDELFARGVELRVLPSLWTLHDAVAASTLRWSMCRMRNAGSRIYF